MSEIDAETIKATADALTVLAGHTGLLYLFGAGIIFAFVYAMARLILDHKADSRTDTVIEKNSHALGKIEILLQQLSQRI